MDFLEGLGKKLTDAGEIALAKGKELAETGKANLSIKDEERKISELYEVIGRQYVQRFREDAEREFPDQMSRIRDCEDKIASLRNDLDDIKKPDACPKCGAQVSPGSKYCYARGEEIK